MNTKFTKIIEYFKTLRFKILYYINQELAIQELENEKKAYHESNIEAIAYHEAGHAVANYIFEIPIECASILPEDLYSGCVEISKKWIEKKLGEDCEVKDTDPNSSIKLFRYFAIEKYCGGAAETKYRGYSNKEGNRTDRDIVKSELKLRCSNADKIDEFEKGCENSAAQMMAYPLNWKMVQSVASALLEKKTLSQSELKEICDNVVKGEAP